jgi:RNA polymerase sigma-70 factor (ECF subfamily)
MESGLVDQNFASVTAEEEFTAFYEKWRSPVRRGLAMALGNVGLADEAVDEAMTRALAHWEKVGGYERPDGWLYRVGLNWARGVFRKRRYELLSELEPDARSVVDPLPDPDLIEAVGRLSLKLRSVIVARYYLDLSTAEVAESLEIPEGTVKSRLSRALERLARDLGEPS